MRDLLNRFAQEEDGATAIEYALLAALMAVVTISAARALSQSMIDMYDHIGGAMDNAVNGS